MIPLGKNLEWRYLQVERAWKRDTYKVEKLGKEIPPRGKNLEKMVWKASWVMRPVGHSFCVRHFK